jgi:hypothetical protein
MKVVTSLFRERNFFACASSTLASEAASPLQTRVGSFEALWLVAAPVIWSRVIGRCYAFSTCYLADKLNRAGG